jgi:hypothetical protein
MERKILMDLQMFAEGDPTGGGAPGGDPTPGGNPSPGGAPGGNETPPTGGSPGGSTPRMFTEEQMQIAIRARLAEEQKKYTDYDRHKGIVERMSKITGRSVDDLETELTGISVQMAAQQTGLPPQVYNQLTQTNNEVKKVKEDNLNMRLSMEETQLKTDPVYASALSDATTLNNVREYAKKMDCSMEQAFWATQGPNQVKQMQREMEQRIKSQYQDKLSRGNILTDVTDEVKSLGLSPTELSFCQERGFDPAEYAALKNSNDIESYRKHKNSKKKA